MKTHDINFACFVPLELSAESDDKPRWNMIAKPVISKSHAAGDFELTTEMFHEALSNFKTRSSGKIPIKFDHHNSNHPRYDPKVGSPSQGYIIDMQVRADGCLWGLCNFLEPAKTYVKEERYQWFSPGLSVQSLDRTTGKLAGMRIKEVSLVDDPHLYDMPVVRASNDDKNTLTESNDTGTKEEMSKELEQQITELKNQLLQKDLELRGKDATISELKLESKTKLAEVELNLSNKTKEYDSLVKNVIDTDVDRVMKAYGKTHNLSEDMRDDLKSVRLSNPTFFAKQYPVKEASTSSAKKTVDRQAHVPAYLQTDLSNDSRPVAKEAKLSQAELHEKYLAEGMDNMKATIRAAKECAL